MNLSLVVLAAGIGSRYGGLKQMDPVGPSGEFILDYSVFDALRAGFDHVVFVIRPDIEAAFREAIGTRLSPHVAVDYVYQELSQLPAGYTVPADRTKPWGTGHATLAAAPVVAGPFAVINADDFYGRDSYRVLADYLRNTHDDPAAYAMVGFQLGNTLSEHGTVARGVCSTDADGMLSDVVERTAIGIEGGCIRCPEAVYTGNEPVSMNFWGFKPSFFSHLSSWFARFLDERGTDPKAEYFVPTVVNALIQTGAAQVRVLNTGARWFGVTYPQDRETTVARITSLVDAGEYPRSLWGRPGE